MFMRSIIVSLIILFFGSCSQKTDSFLLKRRYNKGYHFQLAGRHHKAEGSTGSKSELPCASHKPSPTVSVCNTTSVVEKELVEPVYVVCANTEKMIPYQSRLIKPLQEFKPSQTVIKENKLIKAIKQRGCSFNPEITGLGVGLSVIMFILLTFVYTLAIMSQNPGMVFGVALVFAAILALLSIATGIMFYN